MKIGVVGVGSMGQNHARVLDQIGYLAGVMDSKKTAAKAAGEKHNVPWFTDLKGFLETGMDGVTVATPARTHVDVCEEMIKEGIPVLVEKPIALSLPKAESLVKLAEEQNVVLAAGMIERHNPVVSSAKKLLQDGNVGDVITISSKRVSSFPTRVADMGVIHDLAIHDVDVMRYLIGEEPEKVFALGGPANQGKYEDHANMMLHFPGDITGVLEVNWLTPHKVRKLSLTCSNDFIEIDYIAQSLVLTSSRLMEYDTSNLFDIPLEHNIRKYTVKRQEPLMKEMEDFVGAVKKKHPPLVTGKDGLLSMKVVDAARRSMVEGKEVYV
ncbi:MAG: Gfo/Idh/MocA family oxidoreductase [Thermoplasmata archaeon]